LAKRESRMFGAIQIETDDFICEIKGSLWKALVQDETAAWRRWVMSGAISTMMGYSRIDFLRFHILVCKFNTREVGIGDDGGQLRIC
jgi:hypothetical protein